MEKRRSHHIIHFSVTSHGLVAKIVAKIDELDEHRVHLSMKRSNAPLGEYTFATINLDEATFEFSAAEDAPEPLRSKIAGHDSLLFVYFHGAGVGLAVLPEGYEKPSV